MRGARAERGSALLAVVAMLAVVSAAAFLASRDAATQASLGGGERQADIARYVAEAGLAHAEWVLAGSSCTGYALGSTPFSGHSYSAAFSPASGSPVTVTATGTSSDGVSRTRTRSGVPAYQPALTAVLQPDPAAGADTTLDEWKPTWNYGASSELSVEKIWADSEAHALLRFDLTSIPANARVIEARLALYQTSPSATGGAVGIRRVAAPWTEGGEDGATGPGANWEDRDSAVAWTTPGGDLDAAIEATATVAGGARGWTEWVVTGLVGRWLAGADANEGLAVLAVESNVGAYFASSDDADATRRPRLTVTYQCECSGAPPLTLIAQPGAAGEDAYVHDGAPTANYGSAALMRVSNKTAAQKRGFVRFDLSAILPQASVVSATLELNLEGIGSGSAGTAFVHRVERAWAEAQVSWNEATGGVAWTAPGGDFDPTPAASAPIDPAGGTVAFDVTAAVAGWIAAPATNYGLALLASAGINHADFTAGDAADPALHPKLTVRYTCPCGVACTATPPSPPLDLPAEADGWLAQDQPTQTRGGTGDLRLKAPANKERRVIARFTTTGVAPFTLIDTAKLRLYVEANALTADANVTVFALAEGFDELDASWDARTALAHWAPAPGGSFDAGTPAAAAVLPKPLNAGWYEIDVTALVQGWIDAPASNLGLIVLIDNRKEVIFASRQGADPTRSPHLRVVLP